MFEKSWNKDIWNQTSGNENETVNEKRKFVDRKTQSQEKRWIAYMQKIPQGGKTISRKKYQNFLMDEINIWSP